MGYLWRQEYNPRTEKSWGWRLHEVNAGWMFSCAFICNGLIYIWLQMVAHASVTDKLKCQITLKKDKYLMNFIAPVYPIDWTKKKIMEDDDCVNLTIRSIRKMLTEDISEDKKKYGYSSRFKVRFEIVDNST